MSGTCRMIALAALVTVALACQSCSNIFGSSNSNGPRFAPSISSLKLSRTSIFCDINFTLSFAYKDPQGDYDRIELLFSGDTNGGVIQESIGWTDGRVTLTGTGALQILYKFPCDSKYPSGRYAVQVQIVDQKDHVSNALTATLTLL
jgi:hypothetical protein